MAYVKTWEGRCYEKGIPDEIPDKLMQSGRVPSYKAVGLALLKNDIQLLGLGFSPVQSKWYGILKKIEIDARETKQITLDLGV